MKEINVEQAINRVKNFRDRYMEWAERDGDDINVRALNKLIELAQDEEKWCKCEIPHPIKEWENKCIYHFKCNKCGNPIKQEKPEPPKDEAFHKACEYICGKAKEIQEYFESYLKRKEKE